MIAPTIITRFCVGTLRYSRREYARINRNIARKYAQRSLNRSLGIVGAIFTASLKSWRNRSGSFAYDRALVRACEKAGLRGALFGEISSFFGADNLSARDFGCRARLISFYSESQFWHTRNGCVLGETGQPLPAYKVAVSQAMKSSKVWRLRRTASARTVASSRKPSAGSASGITSSGFTT